MKTNNNISNPVPMSAKTKLASDLPNAARIADFGIRRGRASISSLNRVKRVLLWAVEIIGAILGLVFKAISVKKAVKRDAPSPSICQKFRLSKGGVCRIFSTDFQKLPMWIRLSMSISF